MCSFWNTEEWQKKSEAGKNNRKNDLCLHTGGKKKRVKSRIPKVFFQTHATKECKKMVQDGEIDANDFDNLEFVTKRAKNSYVAYMQQLKKMYPQETECDDLDVWESLHPKRKGGNLFGVGSSDPHFVVTGTPSSTTYASYDDGRQSQELKKVQVELEKEREARKNMEALFAQWEQERAERERERAANAVWQKRWKK